MWLLEEKEFEDPGDNFGYVYLITNNITGKKYIEILPKLLIDKYNNK